MYITAGSTLSTFDAAGCGAATCGPAWSQAQGGAVGIVSPVPHGLLFTVGGSLRKLVVP
ncbi:MAG: hypothetical protein JJE46_01200 [Acidimicrobiia bacterium]|nr:hypothetical protein [Acidimicrobiia bacterium]